MSRVKVSMVGALGMITDPYEQDTPANAWSRVRNVRFGDQGAKAFNGHEIAIQGDTVVEGSVLVPDGAGGPALSANLPAEITPGNNYMPVTLTAWVKTPDWDVASGELGLIVGLFSTDGLDNLFLAIQRLDTPALDSLYLQQANEGNGTNIAIPDFPDDVWTPVIGSWAAPNSKTAYIPTDSETGVDPTGAPDELNKIYAGFAGGVLDELDGALAHIALWKGTLTAAQRTALFAGDNALEVEAMEANGAELVCYWPGRVFTVGTSEYMEEIIQSNHFLLTETGGVVWQAAEPTVNPLPPELRPRPLAITPLWVKYFPELADPRWVYANNNKVYVYQDFLHTNITRAAGDYNATERWQGSVFNGFGILNNGFDAPQLWSPIDRTQLLVNLTNWPANYRARFVKPFKNFLIAGYIYDTVAVRPYRVMWSHPADPGAVPANWSVASPSSDSGQFDLVKTTDHVVDGGDLGDLFVVYREGTTYVMALTGSSSIFRNYEISGTGGILWKDCFASVPGGHVVATLDDLVFHAGSQASYRSLLDRRNRKFLNRRDPENYKNSFIVTNEPEKEIWFCFPEVGFPYANLALVWNRISGQVGLRDMPVVPFADAGPHIVEGA